MLARIFPSQLPLLWAKSNSSLPHDCSQPNNLLSYDCSERCQISLRSAIALSLARTAALRYAPLGENTPPRRLRFSLY